MSKAWVFFSNSPLGPVRRRWRDAWSALLGCSCDHQTSRSPGPAWLGSPAAATCGSAVLQTWKRHIPADINNTLLFNVIKLQITIRVVITIMQCISVACGEILFSPTPVSTERSERRISCRVAAELLQDTSAGRMLTNTWT